MTEIYEVYVGNLQSNTLKSQIKDLFCKVADVGFIWINPKYKPLTYAFIGFDDLKSANDACKYFDNVTLNGNRITVRRSFKTVSSGKSILLDLPKRKGCSKSHLLRKILHKNLRQNKDIVEDFKMACQEMQNLTDTDQCETVSTEPEPCTLTALEETIVRNFKMPRQKKQIPIDFDLTKDQKLSNEQYDKWFKTKSLPIQRLKQETETPKRKIPYEMDYRNVCDESE